MNQRIVRATLPVAVVSIVLGAYVLEDAAPRGDAAAPVTSRARSHVHVQATPSAGALEVPGLGVAGDCDYDAVPTFPAATDPRVIEMAELDPRARVTSRRIPRAEVIGLARELSSDAAEGARAPAVATLMSFAEAGLSFVTISPDRCVWEVAVEAPLTPRSVPHGVKNQVRSRYTAVFDAASGGFISVNAE